MSITPDDRIFWQSGIFEVNATMVYTWFVMGLLVIFALLIRRKLTSSTRISKPQHIIEVILLFVEDQIHEVTQEDPKPFLPFIATLFLFILTSNILSMVPGYEPPTGSLSTTAALAICVFIAVPLFGISKAGIRGFLGHYVEPTVIMLPFNVIGDFSRTLALAVRLFGNVMSGRMVLGILLIITPLIFPIVFQALELVIGIVQAYIFTILAIVYVGAASKVHRARTEAVAQLSKGDT